MASTVAQVAPAAQRTSEVLTIALRLLQYVVEGPVAGGETEIGETKRNAAGALIGFVRQSRAEIEAVRKGKDAAEVARIGRAAAREGYDFATDSETPDALIKAELAHVARMLERELEG